MVRQSRSRGRFDDRHIQDALLVESVANARLLALVDVEQIGIFIRFGRAYQVLLIHRACLHLSGKRAQRRRPGASASSSRARKPFQLHLGLLQFHPRPLVVGIFIGGFVAHWRKRFGGDGCACLLDFLVHLQHQPVRRLKASEKLGALELQVQQMRLQLLQDDADCQPIA